MQSGIDTSRAALAEINRITVTPTSGKAEEANSGFFGKDGPSLRDVVDAINPLEHLPFISNLFDELTGHTPSTASRLAGGAILGGPLGFIASVANAIFEQATGHDMGGAVVAALTGEEIDGDVQVAKAIEVPVSDVEGQEILPPEEAANASDLRLASGVSIDAVSANALSPSAPSKKDAAILNLYGGSAQSAHQSYRNAQMRPYLKDVTVSQTL